jgi:hypothetical protein
MSKKKTKRGEIPLMSKLPPAEQDALMQRWKLRHDLRQAYQDIVDMLIVWCIDDVQIPTFQSKGHVALFHLAPPTDLFRRLEANGFAIAEIEAAIKKSDDVAANWMTSEEVLAFLQLISLMKNYFANHDPGPFAQAWRIYEAIGDVVRRNFIQKYGYAPEQSPIPRVKIEGKESELLKLKPTDHQPELF